MAVPSIFSAFRNVKNCLPLNHPRRNIFPDKLQRCLNKPKLARLCFLYAGIITCNILYVVITNIKAIQESEYEVHAHRDRASTSWTLQSLPENEEERKFYRLRKNIMNPFGYDFIINGSNICDEDTTMVILIHSQLDNLDNRRAIRRTWGSLATGSAWPDGRLVRGNVKIGFVFGQRANWTEALLEEDAIVGGIIQGNFIDSYRNLTLKSLLDLKWVVDYCPQVEYVVKSDDDMFINIPYLLDILHSKAPLRRTIIGPYILGARPFRKGKWKIGNDSFPLPNYPIYETGATYVFTADIVGELFEAAKYVPQIFIDDVYITGILGRTLGLNHAKQKGFARYMDQDPSVCNIVQDKSITVHRLYGRKLLEVWFDMFHIDKGKCQEMLRAKQRAAQQLLLLSRNGSKLLLNAGKGKS